MMNLITSPADALHRRNRSRLASCSAKQFTLIEVLAVIFLISILMALVIGGTRMAWRKSGESATYAALATLDSALELYRAEYGYYPPYPGVGATPVYHFQENLFGTGFLASRKGQEVLSGLKTRMFTVDGVSKSCYADGFSEPFRYRYPGTRNVGKYDLWSFGSDAVNGTADDITNWQQRQ